FMMNATNPFEDSVNVERDIAHSHHGSGNNGIFRVASPSDADSGTSNSMKAADKSRSAVHQSNATSSSCQLSISPSLFPPILSSWMDNSAPNNNCLDDDEESFHDCISKDDEEEVKHENNRSASSKLYDQIASIAMRTVDAMESISTRDSAISIVNATESTSLLADIEHDGDDETPLMANSKTAHWKDYNAIPSTPVIENTMDQSLQEEAGMTNTRMVSPFQDALSTWLSPYAQSARRAGRRLLSFENQNDHSDHRDTEKALAPVPQNIMLCDSPQDARIDVTKRVNNMSTNANGKDSKANVVRFKSADKNEKHNRSSLFSRVASSPALMTTCSDETTFENGPHSVLGRGLTNHDTVVLKEIEHNSNTHEDGSVMHPWTKLILLEELGTASSWAVLLLPYAFMILALFLDGNAHWKNEVVGPLRGIRRCIDVVGGSVAEPYGASVKGYFPVPFSYTSINGANKENESEACTYPFELREGVGLLSHGTEDSNSTSDVPASIVDVKYRYLMSHGFAFTSGVISHVPATSQSLIGTAHFNNLSSRAVALVADGKSTTWSCVSNVVEAFFSLPNTALLVGGDLRVDTLLSHHKQHKSLSDDFWFNEMVGFHDGYVSSKWHDDYYKSKLDLIWKADLAKPKELLAELSEKSILTLSHQSESYNAVVEITRIIALIVTFCFLCYWCWSMGYNTDDVNMNSGGDNLSTKTRVEKFKSFTRQLLQSVSRSWKKSDEDQCYFWWESPWVTFPERRYLLFMLFCLLMLQNPLLAYAFFHPSLYSSATFRSIADSLSGMSVHGMLFLWLCLMHGLRYHTAEFSRRRFEQHRRVIELQEATKHIFPPPELEDNKWGRVQWYYKQYGDVDGGGAVTTSVMRHKHDLNSDSFVEFIFPKVLLLTFGVVSTVIAASSRFPESGVGRMNQSSASFLNPDRFGGRGQLYVISSVVQILVIQLWAIMIVCTSFVTGERLKREPFLSTRPAQLAFRVLSSILLLGMAISVTLFMAHTLNSFGDYKTTEMMSMDDDHFVFDTSVASNGESWDSKADVLFGIIRRLSAEVPYVDTSFNIGPGKVLYATACSLVVAYIFLPSSHFYTSDTNRENEDLELPSSVRYSKQDILWIKDKMLQGTDKRFVVTLARNTHTWRVFPLPIRSHGLMSQHTIKESLNLIGTFQLDGGFGVYRFKNGRGSIFKGRYIPVFCVETACWLLEASWQSYYSPTEYSYNDWAPGTMSLSSIGLKLERAVVDDSTDTHAYVATNASEQIEGEDDSIIVISFRGTASISNMKTDLNFRQVPLPAKLSANTPSFNIRPGKAIVIEEAAWDVKKSPTFIMRDILHPTPANKYSSWPTDHRSGIDYRCGKEVDVDHIPHLLPIVTDGAKAIIRATPMARQALPCVHEGFLQNYLGVRQQIIETVLSVLKRQVDKAVERSRFSENSCLFLDPEPITLPKIYVTGHSLGGSLAQLLALDLASNCEIVIEQTLSPKFVDDHLRERTLSIDLDQEEFWLGSNNFNHRTKSSTNLIHIRPPIAVYTYGQPRVGNLEFISWFFSNSAFKNIYKQRVPHTFRVVTEGDAFTSMPTLTCFGGIYRHAGLEVLLDEGCTGNILVGPTVVETLLRFTKVRTSVVNHSLAKYRDSLESALGKDELKEYYKRHYGKVKHDEEGYSSTSALPSWVTNARRLN
ncbi:hypothetical protein HJC23_003973, partial [Cyclotella cryptica]